MLLDNRYKNVMGIYQIRCTVNNKIYIGLSTNLYNRSREHQYKKEHNVELQNDMDKYGRDAFTLTVLETTEDESELDKLEQMYIEKARSSGEDCYNRFSGGRINFEVPDDFKEATAKRLKGRTVSDKTKKKMANNARKQWQDSTYRNLMINSAKKQWEDPKYRETMLKAHVGVIHPVKLTVEIVKDCRKRYENGEKISALAKEYGVNYDAIYKVVHYKTWKTV